MDKLKTTVGSGQEIGPGSKETAMFLKPNAIENDEYLWLCFREGNHKAYTLLLRNHANLLFSYGSKFSKDEDFVKDCIQDVFFELWNRRENIKQAASVKAYLFKSLRLRIFREQSKWNNTEFFEDSQIFEDDFNIEAHLIHEQTSKEIADKLKEVLASLSQRQKEILYLHFFENVDHDGIAKIMGLNRQSVYNLLYRSICSLRKKTEFISFFNKLYS
ncbi:MAG TPA: sigma-70 family RNA polymerase sigma factor [Mucilaginibacter sp.]